MSVVYSVVMFTRIGSILKTKPTSPRGSGTFVALQVRQVAKEVLNKILAIYPEDLSRKVKVKSFKNGVLYIVAPPILSAELFARSGGLKKDLNETLGKRIVREIRFRRG